MPLANKKKGGIDVAALMQAFPCDQSVHAAGQATGEVGDNGKVEFAFATQHRAPDKADFRRHLTGQTALAVCPFVDGKSKVRWVCIDIDQYGEPGFAKRIEAQTREFGWPCLVSESKSGGAYVWFFFRKPTPMAQVQPVLFACAAALRLQNYDLFPKTERKQGASNTVTLPFCGTTRRGLWRGEYVDQITWCAKVDEVQTTVEAQRALETDEGPYAEWQPCIGALMEQGVPQGQRDEAMLQFAINAKRANPDPDAMAELARAANDEAFDPPLPEKQVRDKLMAAMRNDYHPACNGDLLKPHCNRAECLRRRFGIGAGGAQGPIQALRKINYRPNPIWIAQVDGRELEVNDANALLKQTDFARLCFSQLDHFHHKIKAADWDNHIAQLLATIEIEEPDTDADSVGQLSAFFWEYVRSRKTEVRDGLLTGQVYHFHVGNGTQIHFGFNHFFQYLKKQGFRDLRGERVHHILHRLGARDLTITIKGTAVKVLEMPYPEHDDEEELDVPDFEQKDVL